MRVILELPEETLRKLDELAKFQKRSRKNFMEYVLITHTECADYVAPESIVRVNTQSKKETPKNSQKNESDKVLAEDVVKKIEELQKAANSCQDTRIGRMAKAGYLNQIEQLKNQNK